MGVKLYNGVEYRESIEPADGFIFRIWNSNISNWIYVTEDGNNALRVAAELEMQRTSVV